MIKLERKRKAIAIASKFRGDAKKKKDKELLISQRNFLINPIKKIKFNSKYWKKAKNQLKKESHGKCAYCEANTEIVAFGDVEHFRPSSVYWWLAYTYDNYLFACQICNQLYKKDYFPIAKAKFPAPPINPNTTDTEVDNLAGNISPDPLDINLNYTLQQYEANHQAENAYLINPYIDEPSKYFAYVANEDLEEVKVIPSDPQYNRHVIEAENYYGINRIELKNKRFDEFRKFKIFKTFQRITTDLVLKKLVDHQIKTMLSDQHIFAGMNRYFNKIL